MHQSVVEVKSDTGKITEGDAVPTIQHMCTPAKSSLNATVLQGKRQTIERHLQEIHELIAGVDDDGVLDHTTAKLLLVVTSLRTQVQPREEQSTTPAEFIKTETFTPAEKKEKQWRFHRVKTAGRLKVRFPMKYDNLCDGSQAKNLECGQLALHQLLVTLTFRHPTKEEQVQLDKREVSVSGFAQIPGNAMSKPKYATSWPGRDKRCKRR
jgi:hypothetical protein